MQGMLGFFCVCMCVHVHACTYFLIGRCHSYPKDIMGNIWVSIQTSLYTIIVFLFIFIRGLPIFFFSNNQLLILCNLHHLFSMLITYIIFLFCVRLILCPILESHSVIIFINLSFLKISYYRSLNRFSSKHWSHPNTFCYAELCLLML